MASTRDFKILRPWAEDAETFVPIDGAIPGVSYRDETTDDTKSGIGQQFKRALESGSFNQIFFLATLLLETLEREGVIGYSDLVDYIIDSFARGSDGELYFSTVDNGPSTSVVDPVGDLSGTWIDYLQALRDVALTHDPLSDTYFIADKRDGSTLNLGQEALIPVLNPSGIDIVDGDVLRFTGWSGDFPTVALALAGDLTPSSIIGVATTTILANSVQTGKMTLFGEVREIDTNALASNSALYVDPVTPGAFTSVKPLINAFIVGVVGKSDVLGSVFTNTTQPPVDVSNAVPASGSRVFLTAQQTTGGDPAGAGIFIASTEDPLTGDAITVSPAVPDDSLAVLTEFLNDVRIFNQEFDKGAYSGSVFISVDDLSAEERIKVEIYEAQANGTSVDSGNGLPNGTEGVSPIAVLDSGILNFSHTGTATRISLIGSAPADFIGIIGNRTKYVVVVEKIGTLGGNKTFTLHHGENNTCFINIPLVIEMGDLDNVDESGITDGDVLVRSGAGYIPGKAENINAITNNNTLVSTEIQGQIDEVDVKAENNSERIDNLVLSESTFDGGEFFLQSDDIIINLESFNSLTTSAPNDIEEVSTNSDTTANQENLIAQFISNPFDIETTFPEGNWSFNSFLAINNINGINELRIRIRKMTASPGFVKSDIDTVTKVIDFSANNTVDFEVIQKEIAEFTLLEGEFLIVEFFSFSNNARTWSLFYDGVARQSKIIIPSQGFHNDLLGIQGGAVGDRQHLTTAQLLLLNDATESTKGVIEIATAAEVAAGTDNTRAVTPAGLSAAIGGGGAWEQLAHVDAVGASFVDFPKIMDNPFDAFVVVMMDYNPSLDSVLQFQLLDTSDNPVTTLSYAYHTQITSSQSALYSAVAAQNQTLMVLSGSLGDLSTERSSMVFWYHRNIDNQDNLHWSLSGRGSSTAVSRGSSGKGVHQQGVDRPGFRFFPDVGVISEGSFTVYGIRED